MLVNILSLLFSLSLGCLRLAGHKDMIFQAIAHVWVGLLLGYGWKKNRLLFWTGVLLSLLELTVFLCNKFGV